MTKASKRMVLTEIDSKLPWRCRPGRWGRTTPNWFFFTILGPSGCWLFWISADTDGLKQLPTTSNLREAKPGGFQTGSRTLSGLFLVGALKSPRKRKGANRENPPDHPRANRENPGKIGKVAKRTKKEGQVQIGKPPRLTPPRLATLD